MFSISLVSQIMVAHYSLKESPAKLLTEPHHIRASKSRSRGEKAIYGGNVELWRRFAVRGVPSSRYFSVPQAYHGQGCESLFFPLFATPFS